MSGIIPGHGAVVPGATGGAAATEPYPWVELKRADGTLVPNAGKLNSATEQGSGFIRFSLNNPAPTPADYPSRMDGITWPMSYVAGEAVTLGSGGFQFLFRVQLDLATLPAAAENVAVLLGLCDNNGDAGPGTTVCNVGGFRYKTAGMILVASDRNIELVSGANLEATSDVASVWVAADARRLNQVLVNAESVIGGGAVASDVEANTYTLGTMKITCFIGCDSINGTGPHLIDAKLWARAIPVL